MIAEALVVIVLGFTADDLELLRIPGYITGLVAAFLLLAVGGLVHGARLAGKLEGLEADEIQARLVAYRIRGVLAAVVATVAFLVWAALFTQGVPPWAL